MSISTQIVKRTYSANGVNRAWEVDFPLINRQDLHVWITSPQGVQTEVNDFILNAAANSVQYPTTDSERDPLASGWSITLERQTPLTQEIDLIRHGELDAEVLEQGYDKLTLIAQELQSKHAKNVAELISQANALSDEVTARQNANTLLQENLTAETAARTQADQALQTLLTSEATSRTNADDTLQTALASGLAAKQDVLTTAQAAAVNSGVTSATVSQVTANTSSIAAFAPYIQSAAVRDFNEQQTVNATDLLTATGDLHALDLDLSKNTQLKKLTASGTSGNLANVSAALVSNEAPLDSTISPQIDVRYSALDRAALVNLFSSMPYNVAYTKVGTPIFDGSSVSGFSSSNYLQIQRNNDFYAQNSFEFVIKFKAGTSTTSGTLLGFGCRCKNTGSEAYYGIYTNNNNGGAMYCGFDSSNNLVSHNVSFTAGTDYYLKWSKQNGTLYIHQSSDGVTWTELANDGGADNTTMPSANYLKPIYFFRNSWPDSSVDLNNTYGKINGVSWFGPGVTRNLVPEGTVVGSPTIEDGLLLMPNASNRVMVSSMQLSNKPFEIGSKIKLNSLETTNYSSYGSGSYLLPFYVRSNAIDFLFRQSSSDEWYEARISQTPVVDTWYWWKIIHNGNGLYTFKISTNNSDWTTATRSLNSPLNFPSMTYLIGVSSSNIPPKAIDLKETYIKVNGNMWFSGMIPQVKTCSVVGCTGTADLTQTDKDIALNKGWSLTVA